jgi:hypothetical protein
MTGHRLLLVGGAVAAAAGLLVATNPLSHFRQVRCMMPVANLEYTLFFVSEANYLSSKNQVPVQIRHVELLRRDDDPDVLAYRPPSFLRTLDCEPLGVVWPWE